MLSTNINGINWPALRGPQELHVHTPPSVTGLAESVEGTLNISETGYVYALSSKSILWFKFAGLATYLTIHAATTKCSHVAKSLFKSPPNAEEKQDLKHLNQLASIARKAAVGAGGYSLADRVEQFALNEIDYNQADLDQVRSTRLKTGAYVAKCMQPLFHKDQGQSPAKLQDAITEMRQNRNLLEEALEEKNVQNSGWRFPFVSIFENNPYKGLSRQEIESSLEDITLRLPKAEKQLGISQRVNKYASKAILAQQGCLVRTLRDATVETQAEVECCDFMCYKQQRICGLLYKIDCCAQSCFAIDCLCCLCCFWPAGRQTCLI